MRNGWRLVAGAIVALAASHEAAGQDVTLRATVAAGGLVKAERSAPVRVALDSAGSFTGELVVTWGDARLRRDVTLSSPGRHLLELYVRTGEPSGQIRVQLLARGEPLHSVDIPVRVLPSDGQATLCVRSSGGSAPEASCTATVDPDLLPHSLRGYEAIDRLVWSGGEHGLSPVQRSAIGRWLALRDLERSGDLGLAPQPVRPGLRRGLPAAATRLIGALALACIASLAVLGAITTRRRTRLAWSSAAAAVFIAGSTAAAHGIGRLGPGTDVTLHHDTVLHQIPGTDVSLLSMRGVFEFPAFDRFVVQLSVRDGSMEPASASGRPEQQLNISGFPVIAGAYGLGARQAFAAEGLLDMQPLAMTRDGDVFTVVNRSALTLRDCRFGDGFANPTAAALEPEAAVSARRSFAGQGPVLTCTADAPLAAVASPGHRVATSGTTSIAVYDRVAGPGTAGGDD